MNFLQCQDHITNKKVVPDPMKIYIRQVLSSSLFNKKKYIYNLIKLLTYGLSERLGGSISFQDMKISYFVNVYINSPSKQMRTVLS